MKSTIPLKMYVEAYISSLPADADAAADADALAQALEAIKPLRSFVGDASMSAPERRKALETALPRVQDATRNLAIVLANDGRIKDVNRLPALLRSVQAERDGNGTRSSRPRRRLRPLTCGAWPPRSSASQRCRSRSKNIPIRRSSPVSGSRSATGHTTRRSKERSTDYANPSSYDSQNQRQRHGRPRSG